MSEKYKVRSPIIVRLTTGGRSVEEKIRAVIEGIDGFAYKWIMASVLTGGNL